MVHPEKRRQVVTVATESTGRTVSFWMSHKEIDDLGKVAEKEHVKRNEAARRAVRAYVNEVLRESPVTDRK